MKKEIIERNEVVSHSEIEEIEDANGDISNISFLYQEIEYNR